MLSMQRAYAVHTHSTVTGRFVRSIARRSTLRLYGIEAPLGAILGIAAERQLTGNEVPHNSGSRHGPSRPTAAVLAPREHTGRAVLLSRQDGDGRRSGA
jgi:hypothetical protein